MLPDLRIVIAAIVSTFVLTVGVGFYASSRLINEPKKSTDSLAALDSTPVNRIALSWPAPTPQSEPLALDFAVTAKALRNPVRDIPNESPVIERQAEPQTPPVRTTATDLAVPLTEKPVVNRPEAGAPAPTEVVPLEVKPVEAAAPDVPPPPAVFSEAPKPAPEPDIRVAVQYPPILELPPELQAPVVPVAPAVAAVEVPSESPVTTGSIAPTSTETENDVAAPADKESEVRIASRPRTGRCERRGRSADRNHSGTEARAEAEAGNGRCQKSRRQKGRSEKGRETAGEARRSCRAAPGSELLHHVRDSAALTSNGRLSDMAGISWRFGSSGLHRLISHNGRAA